MGAALKLALAPVQKQLTAVTDELKTIKTAKQLTAKDEYDSRLKQLSAAGLPGKDVQRLSTLGQRHEWDMGLLASAEHYPKLDMSSLSHKHRDGAAPAVRTNGQLSDDEIKEELKLRGKDPKKMPVFNR